MLYALIALLIMLIGAMAMVRSMNTAMFNAGNLGFKRDLANQAERAMAVALDLMQTGALATEAARQASDSTRNYSANLLAVNAQGVPLALIDGTQFSNAGQASNDIVVSGQALTIRYVIDRLCSTTGAADPSRCVMAENAVPSGSSSSELLRAEDSSAGGSGAVPQQAVYRISVRVDGPRNTQAFFQSTFTQ
jgi:hypothetical protein